MHAERTNVRSGLAADPKDTEIAVRVELEQLALVDGTNTKLSLDRGDQRRSLKEGSRKCGDRSRDLGLVLNFAVQAKHGHVLFSCTLLRFYQSRRTVDTDDEASRNFGIESTAVSGFVHPKNFSNPRDNFVRGRIRRFVQIQHSVSYVVVDFSLQRTASLRNGRVVRSSGVELVVIFQQQRPFRRIQFLRNLLRIDFEITVTMSGPELDIVVYLSLLGGSGGGCVRVEIIEAGVRIREQRERERETHRHTQERAIRRSGKR